MQESLRALLSGIIDYAGMFPPAKLPLEAATANYDTYKKGAHAWMLSRFVCGAAILPGMEVYASALSRSSPGGWSIAVAGRGGEDMIPFLEVLQQDLAAIDTFVEALGQSAEVDVLEVKLPEAVIEQGSESVYELVERSSEVFASGAPGVRPFYEIGFSAGGPETVFKTLSALKKFNDKWAGDRYRPAGAKIRTGGADATAIPSSNQLAFFISACCKLGLTYKATAGLHQPLRHADRAMGTEVHGFLNVFVAAVLAYASKLPLQKIVTILECTKIRDFEFRGDGLICCGQHATIEQILAARQQGCVSIGSCSFDEPVEGLQKLRLL